MGRRKYIIGDEARAVSAFLAEAKKPMALEWAHEETKWWTGMAFQIHPILYDFPLSVFIHSPLSSFLQVPLSILPPVLTF